MWVDLSDYIIMEEPPILKGSLIYFGIKSFYLKYENLSIALFVTVAVLLYHFLRMKLDRTERLLSTFPCAERFPILGYLPYLMRPTREVVPLIASGATRVGRTFVAWLGLNPFLVVMEGGIVAQTVLSSPKWVEKGAILDNAKPYMGEGLITGQAKLWRSDRPIVTPYFKLQNFDRFLHYFNYHSKVLIRILEEHFPTGKNNPAIDFYTVMFKTTCDVVTQAVLGENLNFQKGEKADYIEALDTGVRICGDKIFRPWVKLPILWNLLGYKEKEEFCLERMNGYIVTKIRNRRALVQTKHYQEKMKKNDFPPLYELLFGTRTDKEIGFHVSTLTIAGAQTSAMTMVNFMFMMALHPEWQEKVQQEVDGIMDALEGEEKEDLQLGHLAEMKYLEMCVKETLRLYPTAPLLVRRAHEDIPLEDGRVIPQGVDIVFMLREIHRDPTVFEHPERFSPERFLPENCKKYSAYQYMPFSAGPRNCIGMRYGWAQMKVCLSHIMRNFSVSTKLKMEDVDILCGCVLEPADPIMLTFTQRTRANE